MSEDTRMETQALGDRQAQYREEDYRAAVRALLKSPLVTSEHPDFGAVRRHADRLRTWFAREAGWPLLIERDCARLFKRPGDTRDATRGLPDFDRRRYVLLCLAIAVLERAEPQITLRVLGERLLLAAADPVLAERGFAFGLTSSHERRELVVVCRRLLEWGAIARVAGDEDGFVLGHEGVGGDVLYDIRRRVLAGVLAAVRGPSTWPAEGAPPDLEARLAALVGEHQMDTEEGRRAAVRHRLARRLLDDPVVYFDELDAEERAYLQSQRGPMAARLANDSGLVPELRLEGLALIDEAGELSDIALPAEGTESHVTLLVAEMLGTRTAGISEDEVADFIREACERHGRYWRKSAREPGAERELAQAALGRLAMLRLVERKAGRVHPLPALARFALGEARLAGVAGQDAAQGELSL
ncbi:MAG: TIGR02678 family protein [Pseudomonadota bacterium]|jgi:uncharacterized protein (TIGR02678 family)